MRDEMKNASIIWIASYPRSGNTFLRTILWYSFGLRSASIYPNDLGGNRALEEYVGHIEHGPKMQMQLQENGAQLVKTHECATDNNPAIYVVRDGRAACVSFWKFYKKLYHWRQSLKANIGLEHGQVMFSHGIRGVALIHCY